MEKNRAVNEQDAIKYAESVGATHFNTSAKTNKGLEEVFIDIASKMIERKRGTDKSKDGLSKQKLVIVDDAPTVGSSTKTKSGCC